MAVEECRKWMAVRMDGEAVGVACRSCQSKGVGSLRCCGVGFPFRDNDGLVNVLLPIQNQVNLAVGSSEHALARCRCRATAASCIQSSTRI